MVSSRITSTSSVLETRLSVPTHTRDGFYQVTANVAYDSGSGDATTSTYAFLKIQNGAVDFLNSSEWHEKSNINHALGATP